MSFQITTLLYFNNISRPDKRHIFSKFLQLKLKNQTIINTFVLQNQNIKNMTFFSLLQTDAAAAADTARQSITKIAETFEKIAETPKEDIVTFIIEKGIDIGLKVLAAILIYTVGAWIIQRIKKVISKILTKRNVEPSLKTFILSFTSISLSILLIVVTVQTLGIDTSSFVALLAGSGLAIGMALSGTLQNFSGGIMLLVFKPFKVGDYIEAQGFEGTVESIQITATILKTVDNKTITLPNGALSSGTINNYSTAPTRRCDWEVKVPHGADYDKAKGLLLDILSKYDVVMNAPAPPFIALKSLSDGYIMLTVRVWVKSEDYWDLYFSVNEDIYKQFPANGLDFAVPKMNVTIVNND